MLSERKCTQSSIEGTASGRHERLLHEEVEVHLPDARHLVEQDEGALEQGIDLDIMRGELGRVLALEMLCTERQVELPELEGTREGGAGALQHEGLLQESAPRLLEAVVVQPGLDAARIALDVLLVDDVLVGDEEKVFGALHLAFGRARQAGRHGADEFTGHCGRASAVGWSPRVGRDAMGSVVVIDAKNGGSKTW